MDHKRRQVLALIATVVAATSTSCLHAAWPGGARPGSSPDSGGGGRRSGGRGGLAGQAFCGFSGANSQADLRAQLQLLDSTGDWRLDQGMSVEYQALNSAFGRRPWFSMFNDAGSPNALASAAPIFGGDGTVLFGRELMASEFRHLGNAALTAIAGIMAHEWAHIVQFSTERQRFRNGARMELHADFLAGWYMGMKYNVSQHLTGYGGDISPLANTLFRLGGTSFHVEHSHGRSDQRVDAMLGGFMDSTQARNGSVRRAYSNGLRTADQLLRS
ncbi:hypothetical protein J2T57_001694 [Natronocella acetinitrilica]|uniref:Metalloprotease n=1 Tax=Natronocella acetinitrilica TaxID=414046 RepID=A0AAE3G650_9GAMM|nr:hypothetical protein [Natronocella acetinitrilica]MCP1674592.1 hypothetical protein [Natronocella acetinitrilica]